MPLAMRPSWLQPPWTSLKQSHTEPQDPAKDLRSLPNILLTPHIGSNTEESNAGMAEHAARNVMQILTEGPEACPNIVNR